MNKEFIIRSGENAVDFALLKDGKLIELHKEEEKKSGDFIGGDVFIAKIRKPVAGLNAAFVNVGFEKDAFLHYHDLGPNLTSYLKFIKLVSAGKLKDFSLKNFQFEKEIDKDGAISDILSANQSVLVQVLRNQFLPKVQELAQAVNALSSYFKLQSFREGKTKWVEFRKGEIVTESGEEDTNQRNGTLMIFEPDYTIFKNYHYIPQFLDNMIWNYCYLNAGLTINYTGQKFVSQNGLLDLLRNKTDEDSIRYPIIHLKGSDIEIAMTHGNQYGEEYYSFVNGQYTTQGGTHLMAFWQSLVDTVRDHFGKEWPLGCLEFRHDLRPCKCTAAPQDAAHRPANPGRAAG